MAEGGGSKLSEEHIYEALKSLNVPVRLNDLKVPSREFIVRVFECFLKDLQIDIYGPEIRTWEATNHFEEIDMYEEGMFLTLLAMAVNHITNPWGLDITIKDIVEPKPKRTKKILNYLLVFWNYYLRKYSRFHAIEESFEGEKKRAEDLILENQRLDEEYEDISNALKNMQPCKEELSDIVAVKEEKVKKLKAEADELVADYQSLKKKESNILNEIRAKEVSIVTAKQSIEELEQLILSSPERINNEIQRLKDRIKTEDLNIKEFDNKCREVEKKLQILEEYKEDGEKDLKVLNDLTEEINRLRETVKECVSAHQKIDEESDKVKRLQIDVNRKEELVLQLDQKSVKILLHYKKQKETFSKLLEMKLNEETKCNKDIEFMKAAIDDMQQKIDSVSDDILETVAKYKEADARGKEREEQYKSRMQEIADSFKADCNDIMEIIKQKFPYDLDLEKE